MRGTVEERFWSYVNKTDGCWLWIGNRCPKGYGILAVKRRPKRAHRVSWEMHFGAIPEGLLICHRCDTPGCIRPDHLFIGTQQDNLDDMYQKGRGPTGDKNGLRKHPEARSPGERNGSKTHPERVPRGDQHACCKFSWVVVQQIKTKWEAGKDKKALMSEFHISKSYLNSILAGRFRKVA